MSVAAATEADEVTGLLPRQKPLNSRAILRKKLLLGASLCFVGAAVGYAIYDYALLPRAVTTDDAYVGAVVAQVTPQIDGTISQIHVHDTQYVRQGQLLVTLDREDARLDYDQALAAYDEASRRTRQQLAAVKAAEANVLMKKSALDQAELQYRRRSAISDAGAVAKEELSDSRSSVSAARYAVLIAEKQLSAQRALVADNQFEANPEIQSAAAALARTKLRLKRTEMRAPVEGIVSQLRAQIGQQVGAGVSLMSIVPVHQLFVDANFKESQIDKIRPGQPALLVSDVYGSQKVFHGRVQGIAGGTGSAFAIIPAQNATGNWIKVVQRLPVRIALDPQELKDAPLRVGVSMTATVQLSDDTRSLRASDRRTPQLRRVASGPY